MKKMLFLSASLLAVSLCAQTLPNPGFEDVTFDSITSGYTVEGWTLDGFGASVTSSAHSGSHALEVWNWYWYSPGFARTGNIVGGMFSLEYMQGGAPISGTPSRLEGHYKYDTTNAYRASVGPDSAMVVVGLKRWNAGLGKTDTVALHSLMLPSTGVPAEWWPFSMDIPLLMPGVSPDSIVVTFRSSVSGFCSASSPGTCLYLAVDDLSLVTTGIDGREMKQPLLIYPNPTSDNSQLRMEGQLPQDRVEVRDLLGRLLLSQRADQPIEARQHSLDAGVYLVSLVREGAVLSTAKWVVE